MKVVLLTGFLGSGKTTTLKRWLRGLPAKERVGVIVNDLSGLEVDGELVRLGERVSEGDGTLVSLTAGSISSDRQAAFQEALRGMQARGLEEVWIEASGATHPGPVIDAIEAFPRVELRAVIAFVDARTLFHDYQGGVELVRRVMAANREQQFPIEALLAAQLQTASQIALTKLDLIPAGAAEVISRSIKILRPEAAQVDCSYGNLQRPGKEEEPVPKQVRSQDQAEASGLCTLILDDERPFHPLRLHECFRKRLGMGVHRSKGFLWLASRPGDVLLWNQAGGALGLEWLGTWRAAILNDPRLLPEEIAALRERLQGTHPTFGDRRNELTLIGHEPDLSRFFEELQTCLCSHLEVERWLQGEVFMDPWPRSLKVMA